MKERQDMEGLWKSSRRYLLIVAFAILLYEGMENLGAVRATVSNFLSVISPIFIGAAIAFVANMPMRFLENKVLRKWKPCNAKRGVCLAVALIFVLALLAAIIMIIGPRLVESVKTLAENFDKYATSVMKWGNETWAKLNLRADVVERVTAAAEKFFMQIDDFIGDMVSWALKMTVSVAGVAIDLIFATIISVYALFNKENLIRQSKKLMRALFNHKNAERIIDVGSRTNAALNHYIYGMLVECAILGTLCFIGMSLFGFPFALLISVIVGVSQMVPIVGPWTASIIGIFIIFVVDPPRAIWFAVFIVAVEQLEGSLIYPRVVGGAVGISGLWVMVAVLLGGSLFGLVGAILCVPFMAVIYTLLGEWVNRRLEEKRALEQQEMQ